MEAEIISRKPELRVINICRVKKEKNIYIIIACIAFNFLKNLIFIGLQAMQFDISLVWVVFQFLVISKNLFSLSLFDFHPIFAHKKKLNILCDVTL